jgi:hypothetical protein
VAYEDIPTDPQVALLRKLSAERGVEYRPQVDRKAASREIDRLLALPKVIRIPVAAPAVAAPASPAAPAAADRETPIWVKIDEALKDVPDGRYALPGLDVDQVHFFRLRTVKRTGRRYFDKVVGSGYGTWNRGPISWAGKLTAAEQIAADPYEAAYRFSKKIGCCARCLANLTDETSRARGLGPECVRHWAGRLPVSAGV